MNAVSALRQVFLGIGLLLGTFIGSLVSYFLGSHHVCEIYALFFLTCGVLEINQQLTRSEIWKVEEEQSQSQSQKRF